MAFQPCPETAEIRVKATLYGQVIENVLHCRVSTTPDATELNAIKSVVNDWVTGPYSTDTSDALHWNSIEVTDLNVEGGLQVVQDLTGLSGSLSQDVKTNQDTLAVKMLTGRSGRSFRGRIYIMGIATGSYSTTDPNRITAGSLPTFVSLVDGLRENLATAAHPLGVLSRYSGVDSSHKPIKRSTGLLTDVVSVAVSNDIIDSQNRRLPGHGL